MAKKIEVKGNKYDRILKENFRDCNVGLLRQVLGVKSVTPLPLTDKMQYTIEQEADRFFLIEPGERQEKFIANVEWQVKNDPAMAIRMLVYHVLKYQQDKLPVKGYVIYVGEEPLNMPNKVHHHSLSYSFDIINLQDWDPGVFLSSDLPEEVIMAALAGKSKGEEKRYVVQEILRKLQLLLSYNGLELRRRVRQLEVLSKLRSIQNIIIEEEQHMPSLYELYDLKTDIRYIQGAEEDKLVVVTNMIKRTDFSDDKIADLVEVSIDFVQHVRKQLKSI